MTLFRASRSRRQGHSAALGRDRPWGFTPIGTFDSCQSRGDAGRFRYLFTALDVPYLRAAASDAGADGYVNRGVDAGRLGDVIAGFHLRQNLLS
jgi:hypothetical protein